MRATCLFLLAFALLAAPPQEARSQSQPADRAQPLPLPPPPTPTPPPAMSQPGRPAAQGAPRGPAQPPAPAPAPPGRYVAIYAAIAPATAFGINPTPSDRLSAHAQAEASCRARPAGDTCRQVLELREGCGVLVHAVQDLRPIRFGTPSPETLARQRLAFSFAAQGPDQATTEREALARCRERERNLLCWVVASACTSSR